jgi:hypothetical protein
VLDTNIYCAYVYFLRNFSGRIFCFDQDSVVVASSKVRLQVPTVTGGEGGGEKEGKI